MDEYIYTYSTGSHDIIKPGDIVRRTDVTSDDEWFVYAVDGEYDTPTGATPKAYICINEIESIYNARRQETETADETRSVNVTSIELVRKPNYHYYRTGEQPMVGDEVIGRNGLNTYVVDIRMQNNVCYLEVMVGLMDETLDIMIHMVDFVSRGVNEGFDFSQEETDFLRDIGDAYALNPPIIADRHRTVSAHGETTDGNPFEGEETESEEEEEEVPEPTPVERGNNYTIEQFRYSTSNRIPMTNIRGDIKYILGEASNKYYMCPVTGGPAYKPVKCIPCGHVYSYMGLRQWLTKENLNREYGYENASGDPLNTVCTICQQPINLVHIMTPADIETFAKKESIEVIQTEISELRNKCTGYTNRIREMESIEQELRQEETESDEDENASENSDVPKRAQVLKELKF